MFENITLSIFFSIISPFSCFNYIPQITKIYSLIPKELSLENKIDCRTPTLEHRYAVGEKVECRWKGKDEFYSAVVDAVNEDDNTYSLVYDDGETEDGVPDYLLRSPGDEEVSVSSKVGGLQFYGRRGLRSAFGIVDYTNRCREELQRLHSSSTSTSSSRLSSSSKGISKKRRRR